MRKKIKNSKNNKAKGIKQNYKFSAPPYNMFSAYQPGGYYRMFHRVEADKMKRSYDWIYSGYEIRNSVKEMLLKEIQKIPSIKALLKEGKFVLEIEKLDRIIGGEFPSTNPSIKNGMLKVVIGDEDNKNIVYIDIKAYNTLIN